ncbi:hypothetical protein KRMM14A1259_17520 [Krasilnikovia sp. MM14-A1259]
MRPHDPSVLAGLPTFAWDSAQSVAYEVAVEAISQATAAYTVLIRQAQQRSDTAEAEQLLAERAACVREQDRLRGTDDAAVAVATERFRALTQDLRAQAQ